MLTKPARRVERLVKVTKHDISFESIYIRYTLALSVL